MILRVTDMAKHYGFLFGLILIFSFIGCTNRYINSSYKNDTDGNKRLLIMPIYPDNVIISDSTLIDFIKEDFSVSKDQASVILDSLLDACIFNAFCINTDNVIVFKSKLPAGMPYRLIKNAEPGNFIETKKYGILDRLNIRIPSAEYLSKFIRIPDYGMVITGMDLDINYDVKLSGFGTPAIKITPNNRYEFVAKDVKYAVWDYSRNQLVCAGKTDMNSFHSRCDQIMTEPAKRAGAPACDNKNMFWHNILFPLGICLVQKTPFNKSAIDSSMDNETWKRMKAAQMVHPLRDSQEIAKRIESIYPKIRANIMDRKYVFVYHDKIRISCLIAPGGNISSVSLIDANRLDSASMADLNRNLAVKVCDSIDNNRLYTRVTLIISNDANSEYPIHIETIRNVDPRSKACIMQTVMKKLASIRYAYNRRLRDGMNKDGKITVKFAINEYGKVINASVVQSTIQDDELETGTVKIIKSMEFGKIYDQGNVEEVIYPFVFSR